MRSPPSAISRRGCSARIPGPDRDQPGTRMARIDVRPVWVGLLDFQTRLPTECPWRHHVTGPDRDETNITLRRAVAADAAAIGDVLTLPSRRAGPTSATSPPNRCSP